MSDKTAEPGWYWVLLENPVPPPPGRYTSSDRQLAEWTGSAWRVFVRYDADGYPMYEAAEPSAIKNVGARVLGTNGGER